jgi:VanZ family protein
MKKFIYKYSGTLAITWTLIIFILCATPGQYIPTTSWLELLSFDKWVHASIFFILASLCFITVIKKKESAGYVALYFLLCVIYGGLLEIMQAKFFSNRSADWQDFVANTFGSLIALFLFRKIRRIAYENTRQELL